jgi:hypothetical protein
MYFQDGLVTSEGLLGLRSSSGAGAVAALAALVSGASFGAMRPSFPSSLTLRAGGVPAVEGERVAARRVVGRLLSGERIISHPRAGRWVFRQLGGIQRIGDMGRPAGRGARVPGRFRAVLRKLLVLFHRRSLSKKVGR